MSEQIIDLAQWFHTPAGRYLREWELRHCDQAVADCFGYHALQIGGETLPLLRNSRVKRRWLAGIETPVLVLRFEGHTPEALARIEAAMLALLHRVKPDAHVGAASH